MMTFVIPLDVLIPKMPVSWVLFFLVPDRMA